MYQLGAIYHTTTIACPRCKPPPSMPAALVGQRGSEVSAISEGDSLSNTPVFRLRQEHRTDPDEVRLRVVHVHCFYRYTGENDHRSHICPRARELFPSIVDSGFVLDVLEQLKMGQLVNKQHIAGMSLPC